MGVLTDLTQSVINANVNTLVGQTITRPSLLLSDGQASTWVVDVNANLLVVTPSTPNWWSSVQGTVYDPNTGLPETNPSGYPTTNVAPLQNVPIAANNDALIYADVGSAVTLTRQPNGQFMVTGFAFEQPGTYTRYAVDLADLTIGPIEDLTLTPVVIPYGEFAQFGGYGTVPYGATALYQGGTLLKVSS